jgi:hypothetical protein
MAVKQMILSRFSTFKRNLPGAQKVQSDVHCGDTDDVTLQNVDPKGRTDAVECYSTFLGHHQCP